MKFFPRSLLILESKFWQNVTICVDLIDANFKPDPQLVEIIN